jgi:hypothetical protein
MDFPFRAPDCNSPAFPALHHDAFYDCLSADIFHDCYAFGLPPIRPIIKRYFPTLVEKNRGKGGRIQRKAVSRHKATNGFSLLRYLLFCVFFLELLYPSFSIKKLLFAGKERMAL